jgi:DNA-binding MarR family transcriptional regulator
MPKDVTDHVQGAPVVEHVSGARMAQEVWVHRLKAPPPSLLFPGRAERDSGRIRAPADACFQGSVCRATIYVRASELRQTNLSTQDYAALAELRYQIRCFVRFSEEVSRNTGLKPQQHQLMLTLKGLPEGTRPSVGEIAKRLQIKHHSAVELIDRLVAGGYVRRHRGGADRREVLLTLARKGENILRKLSLQHLAELRVQGPALVTALERVTKHE